MMAFQAHDFAVNRLPASMLAHSLYPLVRGEDL